MSLIPYPEKVQACALCESPIESAFLMGLVNACRRRGIGLVCCGEMVSKGNVTVLVNQQVPLSGGRADFVVSLGTGRAVVECDGHEFHERTKEQAKHDRTADRAYQRAGYRVMRFTGQEINRDAEKCAVEVLNDLMAMVSS